MQFFQVYYSHVFSSPSCWVKLLNFIIPISPHSPRLWVYVLMSFRSPVLPIISGTIVFWCHDVEQSNSFYLDHPLSVASEWWHLALDIHKDFIWGMHSIWKLNLLGQTACWLCGGGHPVKTFHWSYPGHPHVFAHHCYFTPPSCPLSQFTPFFSFSWCSQIIWSVLFCCEEPVLFVN